MRNQPFDHLGYNPVIVPEHIQPPETVRLADRLDYLLVLLAESHPKHPQPRLCSICRELGRW